MVRLLAICRNGTAMDGQDNQHARICVLEKLFEQQQNELSLHVQRQEKQFNDLHEAIDKIPDMIGTARNNVLSEMSRVFGAVCAVLITISWVYVYILKDLMNE